MLKNSKKNIVLVGMPGVGKSTIGVLLAKRLTMPFLDTDVHLQAQQQRSLQEMILAEGRDAFCRLEDDCVQSLDVESTVIATGGSVIYYDAAMAHLKRYGLVVWLHLPLLQLEARLGDLEARGVVMAPGQTFKMLFDERNQLYEKHADVTVHCSDKSHTEVLEATCDAVTNFYSA